MDIVEQELFLTMGGMAWAFDIRKKIDASGREIEVPLAKYTSLLIAKPQKFQFDLTPVSQERLQAVINSWDSICDLEGETDTDGDSVSSREVLTC